MSAIFLRLLTGCVLAMLVVSGGRAADKAPTDDVVRAEMTAIRNLTLNVHTLVTHRRMPPADAKAYHAKVKAAVERLRTGTTLDGGARDEIEALTREILDGAAAVGGANAAMTPIDGIIAIDEALGRYAQEFDHPGWQPLR